MGNVSWISRSPHGPGAFFENRMRILAVTTGDGTGNDCAYCHKRIDPMSVEHRVEAIVVGKVRTLHFHRICHHLWESHEPSQYPSEACPGPRTRHVE